MSGWTDAAAHAAPGVVASVVDWAVDTFMPHRHGEVRPSRKWLMFGFATLLVGVAFLLAEAFGKGPQDSNILAIIGDVLLASGLAMFAAYFRYRVHFRAAGAYLYRWGFRSEMVPYAAFARLEMGYFIPLKLVRADGSSWNLPMPDHAGGLVEVLWRLRRAGIGLPDDLAMQTRFGVHDVNTGNRRSAHGPKTKRAGHPPRKWS